MERPKVRFSPNSENASEISIPKEVNHIQEKGKIKVKSIVPINLPIKVLKNGKRLLLKDPENIDDTQVISEKNVGQHIKNEMHVMSHTNSNYKEMYSKQFTMSRTETQISETPVNYMHLTSDVGNQTDKTDSEIQDCADKLHGVKIAQTDKGFSKTSSINQYQIHKKIYNPNGSIPIDKNIPCIDLNDSDSDQDIKEVKIVNSSNYHRIQHGSNNNKDKLGNNVLNMALTSKQENKENNNGHNHLQKSCHINRTMKNTEILKDTTSASFNKNRTIPTKKSIKLQKKIQVMPCAKFKSNSSAYNKHLDKKITSQTKTRSLFNITGKGSNVVVQPEMSDLLSKHQHLNCNKTNSCENKDITSKNLLSRPEYNSAVCVMKKLKEIGEERLIDDVESLPAMYKSLVQGKVSAALDFAPYESVYKNLINLSVDDNELPARFTRTRDPEPRNKDITPSLSMFYNPKITQEHFMLLDAKIFNPISVVTLNPSTISNKICTWRASRDHF